ncbi:MAG TPA: hypothetical protein VJ821_07010 [Anaerolineales bacterium]|nr:hypothetical protein [Anaerolineales bacterium]
MNYLERYQNGEYEQVWEELQSLGGSIRSEPYHTQARQVATETMRRVRRNCERIISRLQRLGYIFGTFPDGTRRSYSVDPLTPPSNEMQADLEELESEAGPLPLSLIAFWEEVGAIDLVGMHPSWTDGLDPLVVDPPEGALSFLYEEGDGVFVGLAPDDLHKDNTSGGDPYGLQLPNPGADFLFLYERHNLFFVPYLRLAILRWGGFPGLEGREIHFEPLNYLTAELESF